MQLCDSKFILLANLQIQLINQKMLKVFNIFSAYTHLQFFTPPYTNRLTKKHPDSYSPHHVDLFHSKAFL